MFIQTQQKHAQRHTRTQHKHKHERHKHAERTRNNALAVLISPRRVVSWFVSVVLSGSDVGQAGVCMSVEIFGHSFVILCLCSQVNIDKHAYTTTKPHANTRGHTLSRASCREIGYESLCLYNKKHKETQRNTREQGKTLSQEQLRTPRCFSFDPYFNTAS